MPKPYIINALDIGSGSIKLLSVAKKPGESDFEILSQEEKVSAGVRKGVVINIIKVAEIISSLIKKAEASSGQRIDSVYANIGGSHLFCASSHGLVSVSRADQKISEEDKERVLQAAQAFSLSSNKEIIDVFPKDFIVNGEEKVKEPVGMEGVRLETDVLALCGFSPFLKNSTQSVINAGLRVNDLIPSFLASGRAVLTSREKELGVCVLDIGAGTTDLAIFEEGSLIHTAVFPVGSSHITSDIAICLKTDIDTAERVKLAFGSCETYSKAGKHKSKAEKKIKIDPLLSTENGRTEREESFVFPRKMLVDIIEARVSEIFDLSNKELKKVSRQGVLPAGIVLTGGGSKLPGIKGLAKKEFKLPCRVGISRIAPAFQEDPRLSTLYGLVLEAVYLEEGRGDLPTLGKGIKEKIKKILRIFVP